MSHTSIPSKFWDEIFFSIVYLINRLPSHQSTPYKTFFKKNPDYTMLRVLGCLCFSYTCPYNSHKLQLRSQPCVFIGYGISQKRYRCLQLSSNHIFVSRNVQFDESIFPFKNQPLNARQPFLESPHSVPLSLVQVKDARNTQLSGLQTSTSHLQPSQSRDNSQLATEAHSGPTQAGHQFNSASFSLAHEPSLPIASPQPNTTLIAPSDLSSPIASQLVPTASLSLPQTPVEQPSNSLAPPSSSHNTHPMTTRTKDRSLKPRTFPNFVVHHVAL